MLRTMLRKMLRTMLRTMWNGCNLAGFKRWIVTSMYDALDNLKMTMLHTLLRRSSAQMYTLSKVL